jgi:Transmembrane protein 43
LATCCTAATSAAPAIGDIKIRYTAVPAQTISVVAAQGSGTLAPFHAANGYRIALAEPGTVPAGTMFRDKAEEESLWTWIWRAVGFALMLFGFVLMSSPLSVLVGVIPLFEELVGIASFLLALIIAVPLTLIVIAAAWIAHRPLVGVGLIVAGLGLAYLLRRLHRKPVQPPPPPPPTHFLPEGLLGPGR